MNFNAGLYFPEICLRRSLLNVLMHLSMCMFVCVCVCIFFMSKDSEAVDSVPLYNLSFLVGKVREMHFFNEDSL